MKSMRTPMLLLAAVIVTGACMFCGCALFWIKSSAGLNWLQSQINTAIPGTLSIDRHRLSLLRPRLDLFGVVLQDVQGTSIAGFTRLTAELDWWPLWHREIHLSNIHLQAPWADLVIQPATGLNLLSALAPPTEEKTEQKHPADDTGLPVNIVCRSFQLTDGRLAFTPADDRMRLEADGISLSADGNLADRRGNLDLAAADVRFRSPGIHPQPTRIALQAEMDGDRLNLPVLEIVSGRTTVRLNGSAEPLTAVPSVDSTIFIDSHLSELKKIFDLSGDYAGSAQARLTLKGALDNPTAGLNLTVEAGRIAGQPLDQGKLSINLDDRQATIDDAALRLAGGTVTLKGTIDLREAFLKGFLAPPANIEAIAYAINLAPNIPDLKPWIDIGGKLNGRLDIAGRGISPSTMSTRLTLDGSGHHLLAPGMDRPVDAELRLSAQMDKGSILVDRFGAVADGLTLSGNGRFQLNDQTLAANLSLTAPELSRAMAVVGVPSVKGACNASLIVDGSLKQPQFALNLTANDLRYTTYTLGDVTLDADMDHAGILNLSHLNLHNQSSHIQGSGRLHLIPQGGGIDPEFNNTLTLILETLSAADFMASPPLAGTIDGRLQVNGPLTALQGELVLDGTSLSHAVATIGDVNARLRWEDGTVHLDRLGLHNQTSAISADGSIQLLAPGSLRRLQNPIVSLNATSDHLDPGDFIEAAKGDFTFNAALMGSLDNPSGTLALTGGQVEVAGQSIETLALDARLDERQLWLDRLLAAIVPGERIEAKGWINVDKNLDLRVQSDGIAIVHIQRLHDLFPGNGILQFDANARGNIYNPDIQGTLAVSDVAINDKPIDDMHLTFSLHDMQVKAMGDLNFEMDAVCDLRQGDFDLNLVFDNTETATYFKAAGLQDLHGTLTGRIEAVGNIRDAVNASAQVDLAALHLLSKNTSLVKADRIAMQLADRELTIPEFEMAVLTTGSLHLKGDARLDGDLNMAIDGRIPLVAAGAFYPEMTDAAGIVAVQGNISGNTNAPLIDARIDLEAIAMAVPGLVQKLHDLNGSIQLTSDSMRIDAVNGFLDTGSFQVNGSVQHKNFVPGRVNLSLDAHSLPLEIPDTLAVLLNGDIAITGQDRKADARGEIVLLEGMYYKDVKISLLQLASTTTTRQRTVAPITDPVSIPFFDTVNLNIGIGHREPFAIENNLAQFDISPNLKIGGTLANPIVSGRAQVRDGTVTFQKRDFDIKRGIIDFVNPYRTEAEIDIESESEIRTWKINLTVKGTPDNLDISLTSVPTESEADILSLILFGRTARELSAGEGGSQQTTSQIMASMIADTFGDDIKERSGVDILQLETTNNGNGQDAEGIKVTVGKHLSDRMTVKYAIETINGETNQWAIMEYKLLERILVNGSQSSGGLFGAELVYRIEFR